MTSDIKRLLLPVLIKRAQDIDKFRPAELSDFIRIQALVKDETEQFFSKPDIKFLLETSICPRVLLDENGMVGFICFNNYPNIPALAPECWINWFRRFYNFNDVTHSNTLFIHYVVFDFASDPNMFQKIFEEMFLKYQKLKYICIVAPPAENNKDIYYKLFGIYGQRTSPKGFEHSSNCQTVFICLRTSFLQKLGFREALCEDNDYLVEILDKSYPELKKKLGDFYIAENVLAGKPMIVMEFNNKPVGVVWLNNINFDEIAKNYDLEAYDHFLRTKSAFTEDELVVMEAIKSENKKFYASLTLIKPISNINTKDLEESKSNNIPDVKSLEEIFLSEVFPTKAQINKWKEKLQKSEINWYNFSDKYTDIKYYYKSLEKKIAIKKSTNQNAFIIDYYAVDSIDERRVFELLERTFIVSDAHYCLMKIATNESLQEILNFFTRLIPYNANVCKENYYVTHTNVILGEIIVRRVEAIDYPTVIKHLKFDSDLAHKLNLQDKLKKVKDSLTNPFSDYSTILMESNNFIIGLAILKTFPRIDLLKRYYDIESFAFYNVLFDKYLHAEIVYLYIHPLFESESRFIFSEIARLTGYNFFYFSITPKQSIYNNVVSEMYPILPLCIYQIHTKKDFVGVDIPDGTFDTFDAIPYYFQSLKMCQDVRMTVDNKMLSIGIDRIWFGFLKNLLFGKEYRKFKFSNIWALQSVGQYESQITDLLLEDTLVKLKNWRNYFGSVYIRKMGLRTWVNFVSGTLRKIERHKKFIVLSDDTKISYDTLLILCSIEYGLPSELPLTSISKRTPPNYVTINSNIESILLYNKLNILKDAFPKGFDVIIYGNHVGTYSGLAFLLDQGISPKNIHFVLEEVSKGDEVNIGAFRDYGISTFIMQYLTNIGVNIYKEYRYREWFVDEPTNCIVNILFESKTDIVSLKCALFINYNRKTCQRSFRDVFQEAGIVIDGRLVIDENFRLNDPNIYSAGPLTKYKRLLFASKYDHLHFCAYEVGEMLCEKICSNILPVWARPRNSSKNEFKVPMFTNPIFRQNFLPGGYLYLEIRQPGGAIVHHLSPLLKHVGENYITGQVPTQENPGNITQKSVYFRIRLNDAGYLNGLICLTKQTKCNLEFLSRLFVYNEKLLNNLRERYDIGKISDFLEFFTEKWVTPLLQKDFHKLQDQNYDTMMKYLKKYAFNITSRSAHVLTPDEKIYLTNLLDRNSITRELCNNLCQYVEQHQDELFFLKSCGINIF